MFGFSLAFTSPPFRPSPALQLYFAGATTLDSRITFRRADAVTCATYFDSTGRLQTKPVNYLLNSNDVTQAGWGNGGTATRPTSTTVNLPADGDFISQSYTSATVSAPYTVAVVLSGSGTVRVGKNSGTVTSDLVTLTSTPTLYVHNFTAGLTTIFALPAYRSGTTATTVTIGGAALFAGTYTAQQIIDLGGIPVTTTAATSGPRFDYDPASPAGVTGPELVTNGDFSNGTTGWSENQVGSLSVVGGELRITSNGAGATIASQAFTTSIGKTYRVTATVRVGASPSDVRVSAMASQFGGTINSASTTNTSNTALSFNFVASGTTTYIGPRISGALGAGETVFADNISVQEVTFNPRGLLIEESRQNLLSQSNAWNNNGGASVATSTQNAVGIDGGATSAWTITESATSGNQYSFISVGVITAAVHTVSAFVKAGTKNIVQLCVSSVLSTDYANFTLSGDGTVNQATTLANCSIRNVGGGWYRIAMTFTAAAGSGGAVVTMINATTDVRLPVYTGTSKTVIVFGAQIELGSFPTSYIVTTGTALTRAADSASMTGTNFSSWFNATQGTVVVDVADANTNGASVEISNGTVTTESVFIDSGIQTYVATTQIYAVGNGSSTGKIAVGYLGGANPGVIAYRNGTLLVGSPASAMSAGGLSTSNKLVIGMRQFGTALNGHIRRLTYYPTRLPNATLQALTA